MFDKLRANILFHKFLHRSSLDFAYAKVGPEDPWFDTINTVHASWDEIRKLPHETLTLKSYDGLDLKAIYYPCQGSDKTLIAIHGYKSHAEREWAFPGLFYRSLGFNVLIPYQRSHELSQGDYITMGAREYRDVLGWVDRVNELHPQGKILIHGFSMGGGIALLLSNKEMQNVKCLLADAPCTGIPAILEEFSKYNFPRCPDKIYAHLLRHYEKKFGIDPKEFDGMELVKQSKYPIFFTAGSKENMDDDLARLSKNCPQPSTVIVLPGCEHGNGMYLQTQMYQDGVKAFIAQHM